MASAIAGRQVYELSDVYADRKLTSGATSRKARSGPRPLLGVVRQKGQKVRTTDLEGLGSLNLTD